METHLFKNLLKNGLLALAILLCFVGFGQTSIDKSSDASSLASVSTIHDYRWEGQTTFEEENSNQGSALFSPSSCLTLSTTVTDVNCSGSHTGAISVAVSGGVAPYSFEWIGSDAYDSHSQNISNLFPDTYTLVVTSSDNCIATTTVMVSAIHIPPTVTMSTSQTLCHNQPSVLTASGANSYTWSTGSTAASVSITATDDDYYVQGTDLNGCISDYVHLYVNYNSINISNPSQLICATQSATLTAINGTSYTWTPGNIVGSSISVSPTTTTIYTVTGDGACAGISATATVNVNSNIPPSITLSGSSFICPTSNSTYTASGASSYTWTFLGYVDQLNNSANETVNAFDISEGGAQVLSVSGTDPSTGCTNSASMTIHNPGPKFMLPGFNGQYTQFVCSGGSYTINATVSEGNTYTWTPSLTGINPVVSPSVTTIYSLSVSNASCTVNGSFELNVLQTPTITLASPVNVCSGNDYTITPSIIGVSTGTNTAYQWSPATNLSSITTATTIANVTSNASYTFSALDYYQLRFGKTISEVFCYDTKEITLNVLPSPTISISGNLIICPNQTTTLTASGATTYSWNSGMTTPSITVGVDGYGLEVPFAGSQVFSVTGTVSGGNGCVGTASVTVIDPVPSFSLHLNTDSPPTICSGSSYTIDAQVGEGVTYTWTPSLIGINPVISPTVTTAYNLTVSNGTCTQTQNFHINVLPTPTLNLVSPINICEGSSYNLTPTTAGTNIHTIFNWSPPTGLSSTTTSSTVTNPNSSITYSLVAFNYKYPVFVLVGNNIVNDTLICSDTATVNVIITSNPSVPTITYSTVCGSNFTTLNIPNSNSTYTYTWNGPCYNGTGSSVNVNTVGIYTVSVTNSCGVVTTNTINILVIGNIVAGFQTYLIHTVRDGDEGVGNPIANYIHFENLSVGNNLIYNWSFGNGDNSTIINPNEMFDTVGVFQVHLYDSDSLNCKDTASATIVLSGRNTVLIIPNSFTPNNDNVEDVFAVNGIGITNFKCQISDRWGNLLYQWNNLNGSWNGIASNGHVFAAGNYFYLLSYTDYYGINQSRSGIITLK